MNWNVTEICCYNVLSIVELRIIFDILIGFTQSHDLLSTKCGLYPQLPGLHLTSKVLTPLYPMTWAYINEYIGCNCSEVELNSSDGSEYYEFISIRGHITFINIPPTYPVHTLMTSICQIVLSQGHKWPISRSQGNFLIHKARPIFAVIGNAKIQQFDFYLKTSPMASWRGWPNQRGWPCVTRAHMDRKFTTLLP